MTSTANLAVTKIDSGQAQKEVTANEAFDVFDAAFSEIAIDPLDANYTLSTATVPQEWQYGTIKLTGALTADRNIVAPTNKKTYKVVNATTGGHSINFKTSAGASVTVANGNTAIVRCDGTDIKVITNGPGTGTVTSITISSTDLTGGGTITSSGTLTLNIANDAVTYAKMQNVSATSRLLGRVTAGSGDVEELVLDTDTALTANSDSRVATQKAIVAYVDSRITGGASDVMIFKGVIDCSANPNYPAADAGNLYKVSVAGKIGGASGPNVEVGDTLYCVTDGTAAGNHATVGANWVITQVNIDGAVIGPASVTNLNLCQFDGTTGKLIKEISMSGALDTISSTRGTILYRGNSGWAALAVGTDGQVLTTHGSGADPTWASPPFDMHMMMPKTQTDASQVIYRGKVARAVAFPANFSGSYFTATANATGSTVFGVQKNGSSIGSVTIAAGGVSATFATSGGAAQSFAAGDIFSLVGPASADATLANAAFTFAGTR